ncbi:MAG TPA: hypothetical protein VGL23_18945 [Chloroflexota bacterium]|jgi:hypothetical protein
MVALAPAGVLTNPASLLARYARPSAAGAASGADAPMPARPAGLAPAGPGPAVLTQISDAARALFARMRERGASAASFDLHLDLDELGVSVDGRGNRSIEGHSLSVDLHVDAQQGVMRTDDGAVQFERLHVQLEMSETHVVAGQSAGADLDDALKSLGKLLADATSGSEQANFGLDDLMKRLGEQVDRLHDLLGRIVQALQSQAAEGPGQSDRRDGAAASAQGVELSFELEIKALSFTRGAASEPAIASSESGTPA